uniref:DUF1338 domain-containing protein n=1 Tax=Globodera pallida TaxID=36090 RepID=A0A183CCR5_GLOPA
METAYSDHLPFHYMALMMAKLTKSDQEKMMNIIIANLPAGEDMSEYNNSIAEYAARYTSKNTMFVGPAECQALAIYLNRHVALINSRHTSVTVFHPNFTQTEHNDITNEKYDQLWKLEDDPIVIWHDDDKKEMLESLREKTIVD